jgi:DNA mismatch repair protein MutH
MTVVTIPEHPPADSAELLRRADRLAGRTLGELADAVGESMPPDLRRHKGWVGEFVERLLGATAGNRGVPDFEQLGIELKTLPVDASGKPLETTYVCTVPLIDVEEASWEQSRVRAKLREVLWVPIHAERSIPLARRMVGRSVLWKPDAGQERLLRSDWEAHLRAIRDGYVENIRGADGEALQIRPKAADSRQLTAARNPDGDEVLTMPRGFYLRTVFTEQMLRRALYASS